MPCHLPSDSTDGYAEQAPVLIQRYDAIDFHAYHRDVFPLLPVPPDEALDVGAGTGRDAAGFAAMGYRVTAVEPTTAFRAYGSEVHASPRISWIDTRLPHLTGVADRAGRFGVVMLTAVWMHLDRQERSQAMPVLARLLRLGGAMAMTLRHGPVPAGRRMFEVSADETVALASEHGLTVILRQLNIASERLQEGVTWDRLVFVRDR